MSSKIDQAIALAKQEIGRSVYVWGGKGEDLAGMTDAAQARAYYEEVCPAMEVLRAPVDHLEMVVGSDLWPMPTYDELLFNV